MEAITFCFSSADNSLADIIRMSYYLLRILQYWMYFSIIFSSSDSLIYKGQVPAGFDDSVDEVAGNLMVVIGHECVEDLFLLISFNGGVLEKLFKHVLITTVIDHSLEMD
jgi:hypothetical protein